MKPFEKRIVNEVVLMERNTHVAFSEDFKIFFLSLDQVSKKWDECKSDLERRLYIIKNMENLDKESKPYKSGEYKEMFDAAEIASMVEEDIVAYRNSILIEMERQSELEYKREEGIKIGEMIGKEEGRKEGKEEGRKEGRNEAMMEVAREMKKSGMSTDNIKLFTNLTDAQIAAL